MKQLKHISSCNWNRINHINGNEQTAVSDGGGGAVGWNNEQTGDRCSSIKVPPLCLFTGLYSAPVLPDDNVADVTSCHIWIRNKVQ